MLSFKNKFVKNLGVISLQMVVLACGGGENLDQLRGEINDLQIAGIEALNDIRELKSNNKELGKISISLALREPVLFEKIFGVYGKILLDHIGFKQNAQCKLSFNSFGEITLETSLKNKDFDIKNTDWVKIDKNAVGNLEAFVELGGKLTGFDKGKMKFTWDIDLAKNYDEWLLFGGDKVNDSFVDICRILKCFNFENEKFGLETCLEDNKFFGLEVNSVNSLIKKDKNYRTMVLTLFDGLQALDHSIGIHYNWKVNDSIKFYANKGLGNDEDVEIHLR